MGLRRNQLFLEIFQSPWWSRTKPWKCSQKTVDSLSSLVDETYPRPISEPLVSTTTHFARAHICSQISQIYKKWALTPRATSRSLPLNWPAEQRQITRCQSIWTTIRPHNPASHKFSARQLTMENDLSTTVFPSTELLFINQHNRMRS